MPEVKPMDRITNNWIRRSQVSQQEYEMGVRNPRRDWADQTSKSEESYNKGVQAAIQRKAFSKGVRNAGTGKWQARTIERGPQRWSEGIAMSEGAYERGFAPYRQVIEQLTLPDRGPVGDPRNIQRVAAIAEALHNAKKRQQGG
jgi:hypothetical protein